MAFVVRDYLGSSKSEPASLPSTLPVLPEDIAAQARSWRWTQTTGESAHIEVSADDFAQDADGTGTNLRGVVLKIFHDDTKTYDRVDSAAMRMLAGGDLYSDGETVITLGVPVQGDGGHPVVVTTSGVTFQPAANSARTERTVRYDFGDAEGSSTGAVYDAGSGTLEMVSDVSMERFGDGNGRPPARVQAGGLRYLAAGARIELTGGARIDQGTQWLECDEGAIRLLDGRIRHIQCADARGGEVDPARQSRFAAPAMETDFGTEGELLQVRGRGGARFESVGPEQELDIRGQTVALRYEPGTVPGESMLRQVEARGAARARMELGEGGSRNSIESEALLLQLGRESQGIERVETLDRGTLRQIAAPGAGPSRTLEAGRIRLGYSDGKRVERLEASGGANLVQVSGEPGSTELRTWSAELEAGFDPATSEIAGLRQAGAFRFAEEGRRGSAAEARFDPAGGILELDGDASVEGGGGAVAARRIVLDRASGRLEAEGDVTGSLAPGGADDSESVPAGLFVSQRPVYLAAGALISDPESRILEYRNGARLWQGPNRIDADKIAIHHAARRLVASGRVSATWVQGEAEESEQGPLVTVRSEEMLYEEEAGVARFAGSVDFRRAGMRVLSDELQTRLGSGGSGGAERAVAAGAVRIAQQADGIGLRGCGDRAEFGLADSEVVLTGGPAWIEAPDGTRSEGGSLTYRVAGDSLQVLGHGADRAYSYRPPSR